MIPLPRAQKGSSCHMSLPRAISELDGCRVLESYRGRGSWSYQAYADSELASWREGSTQARSFSPVDCTRGRPDKGTMALSFQPLPWNHTTQSLPVCLLCFPSCWPSARAQGIYLQVSESVHRPFKGTSGFPGSVQSQPECLNFHWFLQPDFIGFLFLALGPGVGKPWLGMESFTPSGWLLQLKYPSQWSTTTHGCGANSFHVSTSPPSLDAVSFLCPQL